MLHRSAFSVALALFAVPCAWADVNTIEWKDLKARLQSDGPRARQIAQEAARVAAEKDDALKWSNPELGFDREEVESAAEWQLVLQKEIDSPLAYGARRARWSDQVRAAEAGFEQETNDLLADVKTGYVRLELLGSYLAHLTELESVVRTASVSAESRHAEGNLSGVGNQLMRLTLLSLEAQRLGVFEARAGLATLWRAEMGIAPDVDLALGTEITFQAVDLPSSETLDEMTRNRAGMRSREALRDALANKASASRRSFIPGLSLFGGLKRVEGEGDGYVAGAAIRLPLFNLGNAAARVSDAERQAADHGLEFYRIQSAGEARSLARTIESFAKILGDASTHVNRDRPLIGDLVYSYEAGALSLDDLLGAIQIEVSGLGDYYDLLGTYYEMIFRLEALTGAELVSFES